MKKKLLNWLKKLVKLNKRDNLDDTFAEILLNLIEKQQKEIEELKKYEEGYKLLSYSLDNYISKDKIKAKIEEVDYKMIAHQDVREAVKQVLQSLLKKE